MTRRLKALDTPDDIVLSEGLTVLGRHDSCDVTIRSPRVSRVHCCLYFRSDVLRVRDLNSTNGIRIDGKKVLDGHLSPGDVLSVSELRFRYEADDVAQFAKPQHDADASVDPGTVLPLTNGDVPHGPGAIIDSQGSSVEN